MKKKILLLSSFPFGVLNGANISFLALLNRLKKSGFSGSISCLVVEKERLFKSLKNQKIEYSRQKVSSMIFQLNSITVKAIIIKNKVNLGSILRNILKKEAPDIVFTRAPDLAATEAATRANLPIYLFVDDLFSIDQKFGCFDKDAFLKFGRRIKIVAASLYLKKQIENICSNKIIVLYPLIERDAFFAAKRSPEYITLTNIDKTKGFIIFKALAKIFPQYNFLAIDGWNRNPDLINKQPLKNLKIIPQVIDMRPIYSRTRILLAPSLIGEGYCRVITEANLNGVPVIGNNLGAIPETMNKAGIIINTKPGGNRSFSSFISKTSHHRDTINKYAKQIIHLMKDAHYYKSLSKKAKYSYLNYKNIQGKQFTGFIRQLSNN